MRTQEIFFTALAVIILGLIVTDSAGPEYMNAQTHEAAKKQPPMTKAETRDARMIVGTHYRTPPNGMWKPQFRLDLGEFVGTHTVTLEKDDLAAWCGKGVAACTIVDADQTFVDWWNHNIAGGEYDISAIVAGECIMVLPMRDKTLPAYWFFLVGHEFAHCLYGNYHLETEAEATAPPK